jgi:Outer membrane protein beta-barrel domain
MRLPCSVAAALVTLGLAATAGAQAASAIPPIRLGLLAGANFARVGGKDVDDVGTRTGFVGGAYLAIPIAPAVVLRPELLYTMKGAKATGSDAATVKLDYVEAPVLVQWDVPTTSAVRPHLYAGPGFGFRTKCEVSASSGGATDSASCDDINRQADAELIDFKSFDFGLLVGGGVGFALGRQTLTVGARYELGLTKIASDSDAKHRVLSLVGSLEVPLR